MTDIKLEIQNSKLSSKTKLKAPAEHTYETSLPIDYAERLFKTKQLEHKRDIIAMGEADWPGKPIDLSLYFTKRDAEVDEINAQISTLLEGE